MTSNKWTRYEVYNLARAGTLRRELAIVNPIAYWQLAKAISSNWVRLNHAANISPVSLTKPILNNAHRALSRRSDLGELPYARVKIRSNGKYTLQADISNFYGSIYTHSLAWALHGKAYAKKNFRKKNLLGNKIDALFRNLQDGQTSGIPVGPDASLLFSEIITGSIDKAIFDSKSENGLRYSDDYEIVFDAEEDAIKFRSTLQIELAKFRLSLNPLKTKISCLPTSIDEGWTREIRKIITGEYSISKSLAVDYFDCAFRHSELNPSAGVLKFAIGKLSKKYISADAQDLVDDFLIQCSRVEAGCIPFAATILLRRMEAAETRRKKLRVCLESIIRDHAPQRHSSEVAWSLWMLLSFKLDVKSDIIPLVLEMEDSVCALLLIEMCKSNLLEKPNILNSLKKIISAEDLYDSRWLLAYEAERSGWISPKSSYLKSDIHYKFLLENNVKFFEEKRIGFIPRGLLPNTEIDDEEAEIGISKIQDRLERYSEGDFWEEWAYISKDDYIHSSQIKSVNPFSSKISFPFPTSKK